MAPAFGKKAPVTEQSELVVINEAKLRDVFDSPFMHEWVSDGKNNLDHVIEIATILHTDKYFRRIYNSFTEWCCTLFECMYLEPPKRENIKKPLEISNQVKKRFYYLLSK